MKNFVLIALVTALSGLSGCFTTDHAKLAGSGGEHVFMGNYGWKLFNWIPLGSGNAETGSGMALFRDDVSEEKLEKRFLAYANGREIVDPVFHRNSTVVFPVFGIPIPYVITYSEIQLSGTVR